MADVAVIGIFAACMGFVMWIGHLLTAAARQDKAEDGQ